MKSIFVRIAKFIVILFVLFIIFLPFIGLRKLTRPYREFMLNRQYNLGSTLYIEEVRNGNPYVKVFDGPLDAATLIVSLNKHPEKNVDKNERVIRIMERGFFVFLYIDKANAIRHIEMIEVNSDS